MLSQASYLREARRRSFCGRRSSRCDLDVDYDFSSVLSHSKQYNDSLVGLAPRGVASSADYSMREGEGQIIRCWSWKEEMVELLELLTLSPIALLVYYYIGKVGGRGKQIGRSQLLNQAMELYLTIESSSLLPAPSDSNIDLPIALRKGKGSCTIHPITPFLSFEGLSPSYRSFALAAIIVLLLPHFISVSDVHPIQSSFSSLSLIWLSFLNSLRPVKSVSIRSVLLLLESDRACK